MSAERTKHPSGRPIRDRHIKASPYKCAPEEPLTPGLRSSRRTQAIGFTVDLLGGERDDDMRARRKSPK